MILKIPRIAQYFVVGGWSWDRLEMVSWSLAIRTLLIALPTERVFQLLDAIPQRESQLPVSVPSEQSARLAGKCLGRSLARSQYLRSRGQPHVVVIGFQKQLDAFLAHAWLDGDEVSGDFIEIRRIFR